MKRLGNYFAVFAAIALIVGLAGQTNAQRRNEKQIRDMLRTLNAHIDDFQYRLNFQMKSASASDSDIEEMHDYVRTLQTEVDDFEENLNNRKENREDVHRIITAVKSLDKFVERNRQNRMIDVSWQSVRTAAGNLASQYGVNTGWNDLATTTTSSSDDYGSYSQTTGGGMTARIIRPDPPAARTSPSRNYEPTISLGGTYTLDLARSEKTADVIASSGAPESIRQDLESKLNAPQQIAIDVQGNQVTMASSDVSPVTLVVGGSDTTDSSSGKSVRLRATLRGDELTITSVGGGTDFAVTFQPMDGGRAMKVTRRITSDSLPETVFAESYYNRTDRRAGLGISQTTTTNDDQPDVVDDSSTTAQTSGKQPPVLQSPVIQPSGSQAPVSKPSDSQAPASQPTTSDSQDDNAAYSSSDPNDKNGSTSPSSSSSSNPSVSTARSGDFIVPNGTVVTGLLETKIDTEVTQNNDRFKITVQGPSEFRGATIEGFITGVSRSGRISGRPNVTFNFETITLRDGKRYDFAGLLQSVKDHNGKTVKVDAEGSVRGGNQTHEAVKRGGLGAGLGAIIGAIAGGGGGAAIGAVIGGGAGAGSVAVQGRDDLKLNKGSMITVQSSSRTPAPRTVSKK